jgi:glucuronokinase
LSGSAVEGRAFARAGLLGNPSDGYFGRTLAVGLRNFEATVTLEASDDLCIEPGPGESDVFRSMDELAESVGRQGYYGGARLIKAAIRVFHGYCREQGIPLGKQNFTARFESTIPRQVGLGGSSAIVTATVRALTSFFEVRIPRETQPNLILAAERDELGITAGLQDRVVQVWEGLVYMDFSRDLMEAHGHGAYESLDPALLPLLFVAHRPGPAKVSGLVLDDVRSRWERGDGEVRETLSRIADLAREGRSALLNGDCRTFSSLMNENFDLRRRIMRISEPDVTMVEAARSLGASAKLTGSGGAIIGVLEDEKKRDEIRRRLRALGASVLEPVVKQGGE